MPSADQHERWTARLARAPADQASGKRRGARTWLACLAVLAALGTLGSDGANENGSWSDGSTIVDYVLDGPDWTRWAGVASVAAFILAAFLLWVARRRLWIAAGLVLLPLALVGACGSKVERNTAGRVAAVDVKRVPLGSTDEQLRDRLGTPAGHATRTHRGERLDCLLYVNASGRWPEHFALCLDDGRLVAKEGA